MVEFFKPKKTAALIFVQAYSAVSISLHPAQKWKSDNGGRTIERNGVILSLSESDLQKHFYAIGGVLERKEDISE